VRILANCEYALFLKITTCCAGGALVLHVSPPNRERWSRRRTNPIPSKVSELRKAYQDTVNLVVSSPHWHLVTSTVVPFDENETAQTLRVVKIFDPSYLDGGVSVRADVPFPALRRQLFTCTFTCARTIRAIICCARERATTNTVITIIDCMWISP